MQLPAIPEEVNSPHAFGAEKSRLPRLWLAGGVTFGLAACLIFVLPLFVPMKPIQTVSVSYLAGFNNSVALFGAVGLSLLALFGPRLRLSFKPGKPLTASTLKKSLAIVGAGALVLDLRTLEREKSFTNQFASMSA